MQLDHIVARNFDLDFVYLDLVLTAVWIGFLLRSGHRKALVVGLMGICVNFIIDYGLWYSVQGVRVIYEMPPSLPPVVFFLYFSITYGVIQYSYVGVMFTDSSNKRLWTAFLFIGWTSIGLISQFMPLDDATIHIARIMLNQRPVEVLVVVSEFLLLGVLMTRNRFGLTWQKIGYIFLVGVVAFFAMEFTLLIPGIRNFDFVNLVFNSFIEWNMGAPIVYLLLSHWRESEKGDWTSD